MICGGFRSDVFSCYARNFADWLFGFLLGFVLMRLIVWAVNSVVVYFLVWFLV